MALSPIATEPDPTQVVQSGSNYGSSMPTAPNYDYDSAIKRRFQGIQEIGDSANAYAQRLANDRLTANLAAKQQQWRDQANSYAGTAADGSLRSKLVSGAAAFKGVDYVWGGESPKGFDCSGLVQYVYAQMGVKMPRVSQQQATMGKVTPINQLQAGDLVGWGDSPATAHHIAIYAGNGMVWEAPHTGAQVRLRKISPTEAGIMGIHLNL